MPADLRHLYVREIKSLYSAECQALQVMELWARTAQLWSCQVVLQKQYQAGRAQLERLAGILRDLNESEPVGESKGMDGLLNEGQEACICPGDLVLKEIRLVETASKVHRYKLGYYVHAYRHARLLGQEKARGLLGETLQEEQAALDQLRDLANNMNQALLPDSGADIHIIEMDSAL